MTTTTNLGTWTHEDGRTLVASYLDEETVRVDRSDHSTDCYSLEEWALLAEQLKDAGFTH